MTENTFDSHLYQLVENKQKIIGQIMTSKSPVRSADDIDEQALSYAEKKAAGSAILEACHAMKSPDPVPVGKYRGFDMELYFDVLSREYKVALIGSLRHTATLGTDLYGNIQRQDMDRPENEIVDCDLTDNHSTASPVHSLDR